ncbi:MAG TPA: histidinol dehydrogenase [Tepidisphaeraceae bacterium]|nr:histidinol dehydrogenase [Tepidisphaeraceae bacterium]
MIPILHLNVEPERAEVRRLLGELRLNPQDVAFARGPRAEAVRAVEKILADVAERGDDAIVASSREFDDPDFTADQIRVTPQEMSAAGARVAPEVMAAIRRSIAQVREYQQHVMPQPPATLRRPGVELGMRFTPLDSAGLYFPGGKASYPSSLIMLAVPAQVAGVKRIVVCTPPSKYGRSDVVLAACHELKLELVYRAGGAAAIAAMAFGTKTIPPVDKIVGPGNTYVQLAKRALAGSVGIDGFLGPSEILILADQSGRADAIASDLIAQAEHDPGSCFLLTASEPLAQRVKGELEAQTSVLDRAEAIVEALRDHSAIIVEPDMDRLIELANEFAAEHVSVQVSDEPAVLAKLVHAGAVFLGPFSPVAAGDYVAGPSHCLPTNTTARFSSGISVYEFLKRSSVVRYSAEGLANDAEAIVALATAEQLAGHAASVHSRSAD